MPVLHLGVIDQPYSEPPSKSGKNSATTTGEIAIILEAKYHVMEYFYELHKEDIAKDLEQSVGNALEALLMGAPTDLDAFGEATGSLKKRFSDFLSLQEMDGQSGVPTQASLEGISHRFANAAPGFGEYAALVKAIGTKAQRRELKNSRNKRETVRGPPRPSFIDTGLYEASFKAWID